MLSINGSPSNLIGIPKREPGSYVANRGGLKVGFDLCVK